MDSSTNSPIVAALNTSAVAQEKSGVQDAAKQMGLRYVDDSGAGYSRKKANGNFRYYDADGKLLTDADELQRIAVLAIPPAYTDVWISPYKNSHLQATGRDARGRKQYRYHADWRATRDADKYSRLLAFGSALPKLRSRVRRDLARPSLCREKVLALVVRLLESTLIRVGNDEYARSNKSYGLTTLRNRHIQIAGSRVIFSFRGKSKQHHEITLTDKKLARIVKRCRDLPGQELFQYIDERGERRAISSGDVNGYIQGIIGDGFSAKDFRTWAGTLLAASGLAALEDFTSVTEAKTNTVQIIKEVASTLGNTPAICRRCYIHPAILDAYIERGLNRDLLQSSTAGESSRGLRRDERWLLAFLRRKTGAKKN
jgi:DNA topoisomerase-1